MATGHGDGRAGIPAGGAAPPATFEPRSTVPVCVVLTPSFTTTIFEEWLVTPGAASRKNGTTMFACVPTLHLTS